MQEYQKKIQIMRLAAEMLNVEELKKFKKELENIIQIQEIEEQQRHEKSMEQLMEEMPEIRYRLRRNQNRQQSQIKENVIVETIGELNEILNKYPDDMQIIWNDDNTNESTVKAYKNTIEEIPNTVEILTEGKLGHTITVRTGNNNNIFKMYINE